MMSSNMQIHVSLRVGDSVQSAVESARWCWLLGRAKKVAPYHLDSLVEMGLEFDSMARDTGMSLLELKNCCGGRYEAF
jgi:hypothetical protein